jgi:hypothetical protein
VCDWVVIQSRCADRLTSVNGMTLLAANILFGVQSQAGSSKSACKSSFRKAEALNFPGWAGNDSC